jgi:hypothetical protein
MQDTALYGPAASMPFCGPARNSGTTNTAENIAEETII